MNRQYWNSAGPNGGVADITELGEHPAGMGGGRVVSGLRTDVQLQLIEAVLAERWPKTAMPGICARFSITMPQLQTVLQHAGYPDTEKMRRTCGRLEAEIAAHARADQADTERETTHDPAPTSSGDRAVDEPAGRLLVVRVDQLHPDPKNLRPVINPDDDGIVELAESITEAGLLQPIVARREHTADGDRLYVVAGHRRLAAVRRLHWTTVDCIVRGPMTPDEVLAAMLIENGQRADLDPISEARGLRRLQQLMGDDTGPATEAEVARRVGRSSVFVRSRILLLSLDPASQERVRRGELSIGAAGHAAAAATGRTGTKGVDRNWHLGPTHDLAGKVRRACETAGHRAGRKIGGEGCGQCWENVIRADERLRLIDQGLSSGSCPTCTATVDQRPAPTPDLAPSFSGATT